jgi:hypothetical protein
MSETMSIDSSSSSSGSKPTNKRPSVAVMMILLLSGVVLYSACCKHGPKHQTTTTTTTTVDTRPAIDKRLLETEVDEQALLEKIASKLKPAQLLVVANGDDEVGIAATGEVGTKPILKPHQFLHLHHMKTGGTSMDHMMKCAIERLQNKRGGAQDDFVSYEVPYFSIHECSRTQFAACLENEDNQCRPKMKDAAVMSFCSALKHLDTFGWKEFGLEGDDNHEPQEAKEERIRAFTVLRHPVDRVWSMFKFQTRVCYKCKPLKEIYDMIDNKDPILERWDDLCLNQLRNHEVANMLTSTHWPEHPEDEETENAMVAEAVENMKRYFTVIGLTEELEETARIVGKVFPWMNETIAGHERTCPLPHDNSTPLNNHCVENGPGKAQTHWDLPKHPDEETRQAIIAHNRMDMKLYEAAVSYFELQKRAMDYVGEEEG